MPLTAPPGDLARNTNDIGTECSVKRQKTEFVDKKVTVMLELYQQHCHLLMSKFSSVMTQKMTVTWEDTETVVSACKYCKMAAGA